jgi:hypothetical protein
MIERKYQTIEEIKRQYDGNWVVMANCRKGEYHEIIGGEVVAADKDEETAVKFWGKKHGGLVHLTYVVSMPVKVGGYIL